MNRLLALVGLICLAAFALGGVKEPWRGVHLSVGSEADLDSGAAKIPDLAKAGMNVIIVEVDYNYQFKSRPEMANPNGVTFEGARAFAKLCRENHVRVIPQINCLGHQSWAEHTDALLTVHPELDETPGLYPNNKDIYCRSWCPLNPELPKVVFPLVDELIDAFQAKDFHCGMDEVFIIGSDACPLCKGKSTAELFAKSVNDFHDHLKKKHVQMLMWGDRFLNGDATGYGEWEASKNGTEGAIDMVPKDIILCDWHYEPRTDYPSIKILTDKGFRVWPTTWRNPKAAAAFSKEGKGNSKVIGVLSSTWGAAKVQTLDTWPPLIASYGPWK
ncbi:MAG TPA: family 20 glycosylhydrolase [Fimbriimonas sp.]|nr:family 20 glycosylhydrolase [Fimbriimonas sp.]